MKKLKYVPEEADAFKFKTYEKACRVVQHITENHPDLYAGISIWSAVDYYTISVYDSKLYKNLGYLANNVMVS